MLPFVFEFLIYSGALVFAAYVDIRKHEIPNTAYLLLLLPPAALCVQNRFAALGGMLLGAAAAGTPLLVAALVSDGIGGGDGKLAFCAGLMLSWIGSLTALILSLLLFLIGSSLVRAVKKYRHRAFAMGPYIAVGFTAVFVLQHFIIP